MVQPGGVANLLQGSMANALQAIKDPVLREQLTRLTGKALAEEAPSDDT